MLADGWLQCYGWGGSYSGWQNRALKQFSHSLKEVLLNTPLGLLAQFLC